MMPPENMKSWEDRLGPEKVQRAISLVYSQGWRPGDNPPMWVWADAFMQVERGGGEGIRRNAIPPNLREAIFLSKIF